MNSFIGFSGEQPNMGVTRRALLMVEGSRTDNKGRDHTFSAERLETIANNSNQLLESGGRIPIVVEHNKTAGAEVGEVCQEEGKFYVVVIQEQHLPNPKATQLIGKVGLYVDNIRILDDVFAEKIKKGLSRSVSMGLDLKTDTIREISLVGIPSFDQAVLFNSEPVMAYFSSLTWEDDIETGDLVDKLKDEYERLSEKCWQYLVNIFNSDEVGLKGRDPVALADATLYGFAIKVKELMGFVETKENPVTDPTVEQTAAQQPAQNQPVQGQPVQNQAAPAQTPQPKQFSSSVLVAEFRNSLTKNQKTRIPVVANFKKPNRSYTYLN